MSELPKGWFNSELCDVAEVVSGNAFKSKDFVENGIPVVKISNVQSGEYIEKNQEYLPESFNNKDNSRFIVTYNDLLIALTRPIVSNKLKVCTYPNKSQVGLLNQRVARLDVNEGFSKRFLHYYLSSKEFRESVQASMSETLQPNLSPKSLSKINIACPPIAEQQRIVEKLDEVLAQVDTIKARLDGIPALLKRFRQSVLASAVSGKLTEEWRGEKHYDEEGYPSSWLRKGLDDLGALARGKSKHRPRNDPRLFGAEYPFIQTGEVAQSNGVITSCSKWYSEFGLEQGKLFPKGTLCITIAANIADTAILGIDACFPDSVVGFTPNKGITSALFVKYLIDVNKNRLEQFAPATAQKNINLKVLKSLSLPYPNLDEQNEIVRLVEQYFTFADTIEAQVKKAQARVDNLTQSILAKAFRGELVPQDPNDEPADKLLERIAEARKEAEALAKAAKKAEVAKKRAVKSV
ncbi:restriction endonuclease subunit S [Vibrio vulnificus]|uniref:restriction endonuclease subunit S n=1 Tax=Vibrio vulnificus TaxID=672 RepID=UPI003241C67C